MSRIIDKNIQYWRFRWQGQSNSLNNRLFCLAQSIPSKTVDMSGTVPFLVHLQSLFFGLPQINLY